MFMKISCLTFFRRIHTHQYLFISIFFGFEIVHGLAIDRKTGKF